MMNTEAATTPNGETGDDMGHALDELRGRVEARKAAGEYPADLDAKLMVLSQIVSSRAGNPVLDSVLAELERAGAFDAARIDYASNVPLGSALHRAVGRVTTRQTQGMLRQFRAYAEAMERVMAALAEMLGQRENLDSVSRRLDLVLDRLAQFERAGDGGSTDIRRLELDVAEIKAELASRGFSPWYSQDQFEAAFRGTRSAIIDSLRPLAERFDGCGPVLDFGCGRGEMLELLASRGIDAHGVDLDAELVASVHDRGFSADVGDAMEYLRGCIDGSLGGIYLGQVIEHLAVQQAADVIALSSLKLRREGKLIIETVNNQSLYTFSHSLYIDPTHVRPVPPPYVLFLVQQAGFAAWEIDWRSPVPASERLLPLDDAPEVPDAVRERVNANVDKLNDALFGPQDYAIVATR